VYCYVYDEALQDRRFERELAQIETRLTDLGIAGKIARLALFRDANELIRDEIRGGVTTVVAVGNDTTLRRVLDAVGDRKTVVALLPIGPQGAMTELLGMPSGVAACDVLSARIIESLDVGEVNGKRFLQSVLIEERIDFVVDHGGYTMTPQRKASVEVRNFAAPDDAGMQSPVDERLSLILRLPKFSLFSKKTSVGVVPFSELRISYETNVTALVDGERLNGKDFVFRVIPNALRVVTGKSRKF
jgi:diacylglycerol kinase family enzyme